MGRKIKAKKKKGFTLIELIIVIAIIAILAAIAIPKFATIRHNANVTTDIANAKNIHSIVAQGIANEKIGLPTAESAGLPLTKVGTASSVQDVTTNLEAGGTKSKVTGADFVVVLTPAGDIKVYAGTKDDANEVYPNQNASGNFLKD